jgi:hypothetical protein
MNPDGGNPYENIVLKQAYCKCAKKLKWNNNFLAEKLTEPNILYYICTLFQKKNQSIWLIFK